MEFFYLSENKWGERKGMLILNGQCLEWDVFVSRVFHGWLFFVKHHLKPNGLLWKIRNSTIKFNVIKIWHGIHESLFLCGVWEINMKSLLKYIHIREKTKYCTIITRILQDLTFSIRKIMLPNSHSHSSGFVCTFLFTKFFHQSLILRFFSWKTGSGLSDMFGV